MPDWAVALGADLVLVALTRHLPIKDVAWGIAISAASLGLLAGGAAVHLRVAGLFSRSVAVDLVRITVVSAVAANAVSNLALLVALPRTGPGSGCCSASTWGR